MDIPVGIVEWEVFVPDNYSVRAFDGNVIDRGLMERAVVSMSANGRESGTGHGIGSGKGAGTGPGVGGGVYRAPATNALPGQIRGQAKDASGMALPGVMVVLESGRSRQVATTGPDGAFVLSGVPSGPVTMTAQLAGFASERRSFTFDQQPQQVDFTLPVDVSLAETVTVTGDGPRGDKKNTRDVEKQVEPSQNVINLQRRTAGVLPVRVDVPRAGTSHQFVKPLVVDQETVVSFRYKRR
jgi:hypothetical protein